MRACQRIGAIALFLLIATVFPASVRAEIERVNIQFESSKGCSDGAAFLRALKKRTSHFQLVTGAEPAQLFVVTITRAESSVLGRLEIQGSGTSTSLREVAGKTCDEVVSALALMTALAIDPNSLSPTASLHLPAVATSTPPAHLAATPSPMSTMQRQAPNQDRKVEAPVSSQLSAIPSPTHLPENPIAAPWKWAVGIQGNASMRLSPRLGWGGLLFVETAAPGTGVFGAILRVGLFFDQSNAQLASGAGAGFQWGAALIEGCPIRLALVDARLMFYPCLAFHLGILRGEGRHLDQTEKTNNLWSDLGPVVRIRYAISMRLSLEVQGMLVFPLRRLTFDVQDAGPAKGATTLFTVPTLGALVGFGVAYAFR
jgi:hypothetical protein